MPREIYIMFFVVAIAVLYLGVPKFLSNFTSTILGKLALLTFVLFMSLQYGKNAGLVSALSVVFLLSHNKEGMSVKLPGDKSEKVKKDDDEDEDEDDDDDDESDDDKKDDEEKVIDCSSKDLNDEAKKHCETCVRQGKKENQDYKGYKIKNGDVTCMTQAQLHELDRELKKGKKDSEEGQVAQTNGDNTEEKDEPKSNTKENFTNYY